MKNKEKFAKEILDIACNGDSIAMIKESGRIVSCSETSCIDCLFCDDDCKGKTKEWAESEYIEKPVISKRDIAFLDCLREECKFIARDENNKLYVYNDKPIKLHDNWSGNVCALFCTNSVFDVDFPMVKCKDSEPWLIEDLKKLEVVEEYENV